MFSFFKTSAKIIYLICKARHFKFRALIAHAYECMHNGLYYTQKRYVQGHMTCLNFGEISDSISLTVQDRDTFAMED